MRKGEEMGRLPSRVVEGSQLPYHFHLFLICKTKLQSANPNTKFYFFTQEDPALTTLMQLVPEDKTKPYIELHVLQ